MVFVDIKRHVYLLRGLRLWPQKTQTPADSPSNSHLTKHPLHSWQHNRQNHDQVKENMPSKSFSGHTSQAAAVTSDDVSGAKAGRSAAPTCTTNPKAHQNTHLHNQPQTPLKHPPAQPTQKPIKTPTCTTNPKTHQNTHLHNQSTNPSKHCQTNKHIKQENNALNLVIFFKGVHWLTHHSKQNKLSSETIMTANILKQDPHTVGWISTKFPFITPHLTVILSLSKKGLPKKNCNCFALSY